ncbi:MAG: class II aldolase/adducin family protein [Zoogloeaceae bacterium]|jgi:L-fuculose-phosphate aldolase|nr:class II aldolase/adducin family protein [Zoogloeaceae bacterium]
MNSARGSDPDSIFAAATALIAAAQSLRALGLGVGAAGNLSRRIARNGRAGFLITPSGTGYAALTPEDIPWLDMSGRHEGRRPPSSEWQMHRDIYASRPEAGAVLHAHSPFAVSLACLRRDIPPFHYMIARFGGDSVRVADYALFGTPELARSALAALAGRSACLLANHGMLLYADTLAEAMNQGEELEALCAHYCRALQVGAPVLLAPEEMATARERFKTYQREAHVSTKKTRHGSMKPARLKTTAAAKQEETRQQADACPN